jgi:hypothetical protein
MRQINRQARIHPPGFRYATHTISVCDVIASMFGGGLDGESLSNAVTADPGGGG